MNRPTGRLVRLVKKLEQVPTKYLLFDDHVITDRDQKLNANALECQEDNRPEGVNFQQEVETVDQQAQVQEVQTDGWQANVILPQTAASPTQLPELEMDQQWTSGEPDLDQERTRSGEGHNGAEGQAGGQPQGHKMPGGSKDYPHRQKRHVKKFV